MRTKSRAQQVAQRTRKRPKGTGFTPRTRPTPLTLATLNSVIRTHLRPRLTEDLNRQIWKQTYASIPVSTEVLKDGGWQ